MTNYKVKLDVFEGPLDLLLHLIKEQELDIYDIPVALITKQYFDYLDLMEKLNLDVAGEFLVMASTLTYIKSKMLLPVQESDEDYDEGDDPREELMRRLVEYKKYKEAAVELRSREEMQRLTYSRNFVSEWDKDDSDYLKEVSVFQLLGAFKNLLENLSEEKLYEIRLEEINVTEKMADIMELLEKKPRLDFEECFGEIKNRMELVGTLLALLELMKQQMIRVFQEKEFGQIWVQAMELDKNETPQIEEEGENIG